MRTGLTSTALLLAAPAWLDPLVLFYLVLKDYSLLAQSSVQSVLLWKEAHTVVLREQNKKLTRQGHRWLSITQYRKDGIKLSPLH